MTESNAWQASDQDYKQFQHMLALFVHLLHAGCEKNKEQYVEGEPKAGRGYNPNSGLRKSYQQWRNYSNGAAIDINVGSGMQTGTAADYLHWENTAIDVNAKWNAEKSHVEQLVLVDKLGDQKSVYMRTAYVLTHGNEPSEELKHFFDRYAQMYMNNLVAQTQMKLMHSKNLILHGAPGTGKTYLARQVAAQMLGVDMSDLQNHPDRFAMVQFHPGYDYTDFVEGLRPTKDATSGEIRFELKAGIFKQFCQRVPKGDEPCVFVIDEINRGDLASIFGELFFSLDPGYRGDPSAGVLTQYANLHDDPQQLFYIPANVYIIGTMNDVDRSVDTFDFAMRRRFRFVEITPEQTLSMLHTKLDGKKLTNAKRRLMALNQQIEATPELDHRYAIGPSYFLKVADLDGDWKLLWTEFLAPLLAEYLRGTRDAQASLSQLKAAYELENEKKQDES